jgi:hypothetical protein
MKTMLRFILLLPFITASLCQAQTTNDDTVAAASNIEHRRAPLMSGRRGVRAFTDSPNCCFKTKPQIIENTKPNP